MCILHSSSHKVNLPILINIKNLLVIFVLKIPLVPWACLQLMLRATGYAKIYNFTIYYILFLIINYWLCFLGIPGRIIIGLVYQHALFWVVSTTEYCHNFPHNTVKLLHLIVWKTNKQLKKKHLRMHNTQNATLGSVSPS